MQNKKEQNSTKSTRVIKTKNNLITPDPRVMTESPTTPHHKYIHVIPPESTLSTNSPTHHRHRYNTRLNVAQHGANAIIDTDTGQALEYRYLIKNPKYKQVWYNSMSNEIGRLT